MLLWLFCARFGFRSGKMLVQHVPRSCRTTEINSDKPKELFDTNLCYKTRMLADIVRIKKYSFEIHLYQLCDIERHDIWVQHQWNEDNVSH